MVVDRRSFLAASAAGAVAIASPLATAAPSEACRHRPPLGGGARPTGADWKVLASQLRGSVELPGSTSYAHDKLLFNPEFDGSNPRAVIRVKTASDVQRSMAFAAKYGLAVCPRSGGHSYIGASAASGTMVIDLRQMAGVQPAGSSVGVQAGANLYSVHAALARYNRSIPTGTCPTVGASGLTLGGGLGTESRAYGLTCDRVQSLQIVLPDASLVTVSNSSHADLLWAARGGSSAIPGIVIGLNYATHSTSNRGIFHATFPIGSATDVLQGWASWLNGAPQSWWANVHLNLSNRSLRPSIVGVCSAGDELRALSSLLRHISARATSTYHFQRSYLATVQFFGGGTTSPRTPFTAGTDVVQTMTSRAAAAIVAGTMAAGSRSVTTIVDPLDGAVHNVSTRSGVFPWRAHQASVQWYAGGSNYAAARSWIAAAHAATKAVSVGGYVNYLERGVPGSRYFARATASLNTLHHKYDPHGVMYMPIKLS